jgi:hypothetical protein
MRIQRSAGVVMERPSIRRTCTGKGNGSSPIGWLVASGSSACFMGSTLQQTYGLGLNERTMCRVTTGCPLVS